MYFDKGAITLFGVAILRCILLSFKVEFLERFTEKPLLNNLLLSSYHNSKSLSLEVLPSVILLSMSRVGSYL